MAERTTPYGAFNFSVNLNGPSGADTPLGGFSDVSGLGIEITMAEYRNGNDKDFGDNETTGRNAAATQAKNRFYFLFT